MIHLFHSVIIPSTCIFCSISTFLDFFFPFGLPDFPLFPIFTQKQHYDPDL